jgi:tRNA(Glu) U13 pseudouridine synthase TruD
VGVTRAELAAAGRELPGARRPVLIPVTLESPAAVPDPEARTVRLRFSLTAGAYATVVLQALELPFGSRPEAPPVSG